MAKHRRRLVREAIYQAAESGSPFAEIATPGTQSRYEVKGNIVRDAQGQLYAFAKTRGQPSFTPVKVNRDFLEQRPSYRALVREAEGQKPISLQDYQTQQPQITQPNETWSRIKRTLKRVGLPTAWAGLTMYVGLLGNNFLASRNPTRDEIRNAVPLMNANYENATELEKYNSTSKGLVFLGNTFNDGSLTEGELSWSMPNGNSQGRRMELRNIGKPINENDIHATPLEFLLTEVEKTLWTQNEKSREARLDINSIDSVTPYTEKGKEGLANLRRQLETLAAEIQPGITKDSELGKRTIDTLQRYRTFMDGIKTSPRYIQIVNEQTDKIVSNDVEACRYMPPFLFALVSGMGSLVYGLEKSDRKYKRERKEEDKEKEKRKIELRENLIRQREITNASSFKA